MRVNELLIVVAAQLPLLVGGIVTYLRAASKRATRWDRLFKEVDDIKQRVTDIEAAAFLQTMATRRTQRDDAGSSPPPKGGDAP